MSLRARAGEVEMGRARTTERARDAEDRAMRGALRLARRGIGATHPNPRVGAFVLQGDAVVGRGYHARVGEAHAETRALDQAGDAARGATLVVTLEPCAHEGRTGPCAEAIVRAGIARVVVGMVDPNPLVDGRGLERLRSAGLEVEVGLLEDACRALNPPYLKWRATGLPWVVLKSMTSLDGRVASENGESRGLGGAEEQRLVHRLRAESDAVLVGSGTACVDDPLLTVRLARGRSPRRVVLDSSLRLPIRSRLVASAGEAPLLVATVSTDARRTEALRARGAEVWRFEPDARGRVPLEPLLRRLAAAGDLAILVEGGPTVHTSFLSEELADEVAVGIAPLLVGGDGAPTWTRDLGRGRIGAGIAIGPLAVRRLGKDVWLSGLIERSRSAPAEGPRSV